MEVTQQYRHRFERVYQQIGGTLHWCAWQLCSAASRRSI